MLHLKILESKSKQNPKQAEIIKVRDDINEIETKKKNCIKNQ
jgi:hypothetical protein